MLIRRTRRAVSNGTYFHAWIRVFNLEHWLQTWIQVFNGKVENMDPGVKMCVVRSEEVV